MERRGSSPFTVTAWAGAAAPQHKGPVEGAQSPQQLLAASAGVHLRCGFVRPCASPPPPPPPHVLSFVVCHVTRALARIPHSVVALKCLVFCTSLSPACPRTLARHLTRPCCHSTSSLLSPPPPPCDSDVDTGLYKAIDSRLRNLPGRWSHSGVGGGPGVDSGAGEAKGEAGLPRSSPARGVDTRSTIAQALHHKFVGK